ncbi:MAG: SMC family ATPase, partial [Cyanobacteria bacterium J06642_2]
MRILSASLKNFKTHQDSYFEFSTGTNAICGENGAGKTSILEAIAWVLFDYTPYVTDEMIREGASSAEVTVSFVSALEERTYDVTRSTTTGYRLYDPQLDRRLEYEKKADVLPWLRQHLGVPVGTDMPKLFSHTIGVPQGTFTADFLKRSQDRKKVFDSILKVEEYQAVYKDLLGIEKYGKAQVTEIEHQIDIYATQLKDWDDLTTRKQDLTAAIAADTTKLQQLNEQLEQSAKEIATLDGIAAQLGETEQQWQELERKIALSVQVVAQKQQAEAEAEAARDRLVSFQAGRDTYLQAETTLKQLEEQRQIRQDVLSKREAMLEANRDRQAQLIRLQERLDTLTRASEEIEALKPQVEQQDLLEKQQKDSTAIAAGLQELRHERALMQTRFEEQQGRVGQQDKLAAEAQSARDVCQQNTAGYKAFLTAREHIQQL